MHLQDKLSISPLLSLLMPNHSPSPSSPLPPTVSLKTPTGEDIVWLLNFEGKIAWQREVCVCWLGIVNKKGEREWGEKKERKQLGNPLFEHFVLCASFVYWVPTLAGRLWLFSQTKISIVRFVVRSMWCVCASFLFSRCLCAFALFRWGGEQPHQLRRL